MKLFVRTVCFHIICIFIFALMYDSLKHHFHHQFRDRFDFLDYFLLSTTIQAGVGISDIYPITTYGKIAMITQQFIMIMTHVFTIYVFNL